MDARLQLRVQRHGWDRASAHYERGWREALAPAHDRLLALAALRPGERVLDVAAGSGLVSAPAAEQVGPHGHLLGVDLSDEMVSLARRRCASLGHAQAGFARMNAEQLELADASFDAWLCALGLMYAPHPLAALREARRVLVPGGRAVCAVWGAREACGWSAVFDIVQARVQSEVCPLFFQLGASSHLARHLEWAGMLVSEVELLDTELRYATAADALEAAFAAGPVALAWSRFDASTRASAEAEYLAAIERYRHAAGYRIAAQFVVARAHRPVR